MAPKPTRQYEYYTHSKKFSDYDIDGDTLEEAIQHLTEFYEDCIKDIDNYDLSNRPVEYEKVGPPTFTSEYDYCDQQYATVHQRYQETDKSLENRIEQWKAARDLKKKVEEKNRLKNAKEQKEERRKMYEKLRKEFE